MEYIIRSAAGANLQTSLLLGKPLTVAPNSTLNQKFSIQQNTALANNDVVSMKYAVIGNKGHRMVTDANGIPYPYPLQHQPRHASLYNHMPFVLRLPANDLTAAERARFRLRRIEQHGGVTYVAYYAIVLDMSLTLPTMELRTVADGITTSTPFEYTLDDLNPTPPNTPPGTVITTSGDYIASTSKVPFALTASDITELLNVANILYGNDNLAIISEVGLAHGADRVVSGDFNGVSTSYTEVISAQISNFISTFYPAKFMNAGVSTVYDCGSVEPLYNLT